MNMNYLNKVGIENLIILFNFYNIMLCSTFFFYQMLKFSSSQSTISSMN